MKRGFSLATKLLLAFALLAGLFPATAGSQPPDKVRVLIGFLAEPDEDDEDMINSLDGEVEHSYNLVPVIAATVPAHRIAKLEEDPEVAYIEPDILVDAVQDTLPWGVDRIDADLAWPTSKGLGAQVAVVDTGIDLNHPDLAVNIAGDVNFVNPARTGNDDNGHGTHVAGTVAADDNGTGVVGVAPDASLYAVKVLNRRGSGWLSDVIAGIDWAVRGPDGVLGNVDDAEVINLSLGCACPSLSLQMAVDNAYAQGTLVVGAAGNDPDEPVIYPAAFASVIAVSATTIGDGLAGFSSIGPEVELAAPGQSITSTYAGGSYAVLSGTSMAAPHVSGAAALVFALGGQTNVGVRQVLQTTAENIGLDPVEQGYGLVDAQAAVGAPPPPPPTLVSIAVAPTTASIVEGSTQQFTATGTFSDGST
ncbi:MAG: S8 family serine peptidase, partial [Dehalococcoidia bacterium]